MDLLALLDKEVKALSHLLGMRPARPLPKEVKISDVPASVHSKSSLRNGRLLISRELNAPHNLILKKEAFSLFIPEEADYVPQVHGMSWFYANASKSLWLKFKEEPPNPFKTFDVYDYLKKLENKIDGLRNLLAVIRAAALSGELTFPIFTGLVRRCTTRPYKLTKSQLSVLDALVSKPTSDMKELSERAKVPYSTLWKALAGLKEEDLISGPENVDIGMLGLDTFVLSFPNVKELRSAFWEFPFTYNQLIPFNKDKVHAFVLAPRDSLVALSALEKLGIEVGRVTMIVQSFNFRVKDEGVGDVLRRALAESYSFRRRHSSRISLKLKEDDLKVLNQILLHGTTSSTKLRKLGIKSAKRRLGQLRELGFIKRYYTVGSPPGTRVIVVRASCQETDVGKIFSLFRSAPEVQVVHVSAREEYCLAVAHVYPGSVESFVLASKLLLGEKLSFAGEAYDIVPTWTLPVELWRPSKGFRWEEPIDELVRRLEAALNSIKSSRFDDMWKA